MGCSLVVIHDRPIGCAPTYVSALSSISSVLAVNLRSITRLDDHVGVPWLIDVETPNEAKASRLRTVMTGSARAPRLLVVSVQDRLTMIQANALGATGVLPRPVTIETIRRLLEPMARGGAAPIVTTVTTSITGACEALDQVFSACVAGTPIDVPALRQAAAMVSPAVRDGGLATWLELVRQHHAGTYRHILQVMGIAVSLGQKLSLDGVDIDRLALGAMLHDTGKCWTPEAILDKPGKLTEAEFAVMRRHSSDGWSALRAANLDLDEDVYEAVLHHHEYLDGSGYPDGLVAAAIRPLTRIITVCDIYGALIEWRPYRSPLPPLEALSILETLAIAGKIDGSLVGALFRLVGFREAWLGADHLTKELE